MAISLTQAFLHAMRCDPEAQARENEVTQTAQNPVTFPLLTMLEDSCHDSLDSSACDVKCGIYSFYITPVS